MGKPKMEFFRRFVRIFALFGFAFALSCALSFGTYFASCGIPKLWDWQWHMCISAHWNAFLGVTHAYGQAKLLLLTFRLLEFAMRLLFVLAFLWLFVTTRAGRYAILLLGFLFGVAQRLLTHGQGSLHADLGWHSMWMALLIAFATGASYLWLQMRGKLQWKRWTSFATWGVLSMLLITSQPIAASVLAMLVDPCRLMRDMHLPEPVIEAMLSVCFFALFYTSVIRLDGGAMLLIGLIVLSGAFFPALHSVQAERQTA